ncbi:hypothetical protein [Actinomadura rubrisoli]|uniref:Uncharacterized protein n=1 Tax=Actinomadura rubrisoli TaxID=2530368 RepID=A0A4R4ZLW2_9ACTN|nr:hypothetical protein [Actinomadura rubrisoli]TDD59210.1 hypothetical protein E1298_46745 [Actinomadura rubrisoli]
MRIILLLVLLPLAGCSGSGGEHRAAVPSTGRPSTSTCGGPRAALLSDRVIDGAIGREPVWLWLPHAYDSVRGALSAQATTFGRHGWGFKAAWGIRSGARGPVTAHGRNRVTGHQVWFAPNLHAPTTRLTLDTRTPLDRSGGWLLWQGQISLPESGCYDLQAD